MLQSPKHERTCNAARTAARVCTLACGVTNARALQLTETRSENEHTRWCRRIAFRTQERDGISIVRGHGSVPRAVSDLAIGLIRGLINQTRIARRRLKRRVRLTSCSPRIRASAPSADSYKVPMADLPPWKRPPEPKGKGKVTIRPCGYRDKRTVLAEDRILVGSLGQGNMGFANVVPQRSRKI